MAASVTAAVALVALVCAWLPVIGTVQRAQNFVRVRILHVAQRPIPTPTPKRTPPIRIRARKIARQRARPRVVDPGTSRPLRVAHVVLTRPARNRAANGKPIWDIGMGGHGANGAGTAASGAGAGGPGAAEQPCGAVDFVSARVSQDPATGLYLRNDIVIVVHFPDGHSESAKLDYPWHYRDPNFDPFKHADAPMWFQFPPQALRLSEPPLVQYVMAHSSIEGSTNLNECPGERPPSIPSSLPP
jgi:hypothetical protein